MDPARFTRVDETTWRIEPVGAMRVPGIIFADQALLQDMDDKVCTQTANVATLPGIVTASYAMPDAHWGYGFPIGGVAAFDAERGGIISAGGVGFDISCGVRTLLTGIPAAELKHVQHALADSFFRQIPAGLGSHGAIVLEPAAMDAMLSGGARWAIEQGFGDAEDLERIEEGGAVAGARPDCVSDQAKKRQRREMGTLGSGNHYLEVQAVAEIFDREGARAFGLVEGETVVTIHCGSRGLGHQIGSEFLKEMVVTAGAAGISLPDRELACAPITSEIGQRYLGAMRAATNCALANREILSHFARRVMRHFFPAATMRLLFDVSHNTCKLEKHRAGNSWRELFVHRKGATRAFAPGHPSLPREFRDVGQPVLIGGSMGTGSYVLAGMQGNENKGFSSACHGAGRAMSRHAALKRWSGRQIGDALLTEGIVIRSPSMRGVAEEAPGAYKDIDAVVGTTERAGLARRVARLRPLICIKG
jgi:tRNA-splicing ligase RtcB